MLMMIGNKVDLVYNKIKKKKRKNKKKKKKKKK